MEMNKSNCCLMAKEGSYKVKFTESEKSVKYEVAVEHPDKDQCLESAKELAHEAGDFAKVQTLKKQM